MTMAPSQPLRCHLLIGPPASGKTTLAGVLAELTGAVVLSTDVVRGELFGDAAVQGPWRDIEALLHQRIRESVAAGVPVIVDATHARRPWRLALTQALSLSAPVEWIGWWLYTSLGTCLQWNQSRKRLVPEPVIREMAAALADPVFGPSRAEGFAAVVAVVPTHQRELAPLLRDELARLDHRLRSARNREKHFALHGYSRLLDLERYASVGSFADSPAGSFRVWPLQLLFHNIGWYLVYEEDAIGTSEGLIRSERIDRLALRRSERGNRRGDDAHAQALKRLELLLHHSGGIYFGDNLEAQLRLASPNPRLRATQLVTLRFCCQGWRFAFIREGLQRYPIEHTRFSKPLPGEHWWHHPKAPHVLEPGSAADSHPYPVELDLPPWTVERDIDLRNWLFGFGAGIPIDSPAALRDEHRQKLETALAVYQAA